MQNPMTQAPGSESLIPMNVLTKYAITKAKFVIVGQSKEKSLDISKQQKSLNVA